MNGARAGAILIAALAATLTLSSAGSAAPESSRVIASMDLSRAFGTRTAWQLTLTQGPGIPNTDDGPVPGIITPCLKRVADRSCAPTITRLPEGVDPQDVSMLDPRYLYVARIVYPRGQGAQPLLQLRTGGSFGFDGSQPLFTQILAYHRATDRFERVFSQMTGRNMNQEIRFVASGPLRGDVIVAEPAERSPWRYWVTVHRLDASYRYRQILRYRSATPYGDDNPLEVIDSEMPNIQRQLGLWRPGMPLPLPAKGCPRPRLVKMELWCA